MERITSLQNPLIRHIRKLQSDAKYRKECREFVADGYKLLDEALKWYPEILTVICSDESRCPSLPDNVRLVSVPVGLMQSLSEMKTPQGVVFTCRMPQQIRHGVRPCSLVLDRIQDPGNLGTILRTADAFGIPVILTNGCADAYSLKTLRASMGAVLRTHPVALPMEELLRDCSERNIPLIATALTEYARDIRETDLRQGLVVIGSEGQGICDTLLHASRDQIIIPMQPRCESLNAAVAAAIVMWQMQ